MSHGQIAYEAFRAVYITALPEWDALPADVKAAWEAAAAAARAA